MGGGLAALGRKAEGGGKRREAPWSPPQLSLLATFSYLHLPSPGATPLRDRGEARYVGHGWGWGARQWSGPPDQQTTPASA